MRLKTARWRPVPYKGLHQRLPRRAVLIHTNGGGTDKGSLFGWWSGIARKGQHLGAQIQIPWNGKAEQYVDTDLVVYHAYSASEWAVGIEVQDDGDPTKPMTLEQVNTIIAICRELQVPAKLLTSSGEGDGVGWHEQYAAWNHDAHKCPGPVREKQVREQILPALKGRPLPAWFRRPLSQGSKGSDVSTLKRRLRRLGYKGIFPGPVFGPGLDAAVRRFQELNHLTPDGVFGPITARALRAAW